MRKLTMCFAMLGWAVMGPSCPSCHVHTQPSQACVWTLTAFVPTTPPRQTQNARVDSSSGAEVCVGVVGAGAGAGGR